MLQRTTASCLPSAVKELVCAVLRCSACSFRKQPRVLVVYGLWLSVCKRIAASKEKAVQLAAAYR